MSTSNFDSGSEDHIHRLRSETFIRRIVKALTRRYPLDIDAVVSAVHDACRHTEEVLADGRNIRNLESFVKTCACRRLQRYLKAESRRRSVEHDLNVYSTHADDIPDQLDRAECIEKLRSLLPKLSPTAKEIIRLHFFEGMSVENIAVQLHMGRSTTFGKLRDSLDLLRSWLL